MAAAPIDLSAGLVPKPVDLSAGLVPKTDAPAEKSLWQKAKDNFNANTQGAKPGDGAVKGFIENVGQGGGQFIRSLAHPLDQAHSEVDSVRSAVAHPMDAAQGALDQAHGEVDALRSDPSRFIGNAIGQAGTGAILGGAAGEAVSRVVPKISAALTSPPKSGNLPSVWDRATSGPQSTVMPSAAKLPLAAQSGVEDIFRAAAPTGKNIGFRENLNVVAPDLADIARKVDISEAKGGIINPDMRVRATVDAIRSHLDEMYQNERAPQIERNAQLPVKVGTNPNAVRGLEYLEGTAGDVADSQLARKALDGATLTVAEADKLAKVANQTLLSFERATPEGKMQLQTANPKVGGLKALDNDLRDNLNGVLMDNGEKGLYSYERRYAGLSSVLDQLQTRMNATELKQEGVFGAVGRYTRPALKVIKEGPSGVPSASQAAVSDVNIGRTLQTGLKKLKSSGITASGSKQ